MITRNTALSAVASLAILLAMPNFAMADHRDRGHFGGDWRGSHFDHHRGSNFSFSLGLGAIFAPSYRYRSDDCYEPVYYRTLYREYCYERPAVVYRPVYCDPAPVYYSDTYY